MGGHRRGSYASSGRSPETEAESLSRPSSRSSTRSSTPSLAFSNHYNNGVATLASHSTRSSISFEDLESAKVT